MRSSHASIARSSSRLPGALERAVVAEQPPDGHPLVQPALLGQVADAVVGGPRAALAQDLDLAAVGQQDVHDHPQRRRLARPVGADEAVERPRGTDRSRSSTATTPPNRLVTPRIRMASFIGKKSREPRSRVESMRSVGDRRGHSSEAEEYSIMADRLQSDTITVGDRWRRIVGGPLST